MSQNASLAAIVTPEWCAHVVAALPGAESSFKADWDAHILGVGGKQFARLGTDRTGRPILTVKGDPLENEALRQEFPEVVPGYYSNKQHWNSILLAEATVTPEHLAEMIVGSYEIVFASLTRKLQAELRAAALR